MSEDTTAAAGPSTVSPSSSNSLPPLPPNLPPKPEDNHHESNNDNTDNPDSLVILDSSNLEQQPVCVICEKNVAIYTCPRCSTRTCSLICSTGHKTRGEGCSGIRNKAAYVPMNQYGYMALMDDYVYLEDVGRKVGEWGKEIVQGGYTSNNNTNGYHNPSSFGRGNLRGRGGRGRGMGMMRGRGGRVLGHAVQSKRDVLKMELDFLDIEMDLLPVGMERRTLNQSTWDPKMKTALLTIQFMFHPPRDPYAPSSLPTEPPLILLTHRNRLDQSILTCIQTRLMDRPKSKKDSYPQWLTDMILPPPEDSNPESFVRPTCVMPTRVDPLASLQQSRGNSIGNGSFSFLRPGHIVREGFYKLDPDTTLSEALKHKEFVEFPTIEVWEDGAFTGTIVDDRGAVLLDSDEERKPKRRKMGAKEGKKAISGLLGGYGSGSEDEAEEEQNVLNALAGYTGSEDEDDDMQGSSDTAKSLRPGEVWLKEEDLVDEDAEGETDDEEYEEENVEDLAGILEKLRQAGALRDPVDSSYLDGQGDDDQVDWGDSDNET